MPMNPDFAAPCGLHCGVCAILIAGRENNDTFKDLLIGVFQGKYPGTGKLPGAENLTRDDIRCGGCLSDDRFMHCRRCEIRSCTVEKGIEGCHECNDFPCGHVDHFPMNIGKKVILRTVPYRREVGTEQWMQDEEARYSCPECGNALFRGAVMCNRCRSKVDLD